MILTRMLHVVDKYIYMEVIWKYLKVFKAKHTFRALAKRYLLFNGCLYH